ncbi:MAG TPA: glycerol-3-phosphate 1-O-acyltransferase PlsY [Thermomicrobiaceae bacterium]|nr:glycerol-3-phosphate 1-O-acyltransferase PlsY [Thermomicrobiaceae bacterium]
MSWLAAALLALFGYLLGSIPSGLLLGRVIGGVDVRRQGSGNIGSANVYRSAGRPAAALTLAADLLKGALPVILARAFGLPLWVSLLAGLCAVIGHNWSLYLHGRGGKGIATSLGVLAALAPLAALIAAAIWLVVLKLSRYASLASLAMLAAAPLLLALFGHATAYWVFGLILLVLAIARHRANLRRLLAGTELKLDGDAGSSPAPVSEAGAADGE